MGNLLETLGQNTNTITRKTSGGVFNFLQDEVIAVEGAQANITALQAQVTALQLAVAALQTASGRVIQTLFKELTADTSFTTGQAILSQAVATTTVNGVLEINWTASCSGNTAATFYKIFLKVDGVTVQCSRFTLDAASATFAFAMAGVKRITGVAPGAHTVLLEAQCGAATMTFSISGPNDNAALLIKEILP
jgi:hypothetical protein